MTAALFIFMSTNENDRHILAQQKTAVRVAEILFGIRLDAMTDFSKMAGLMELLVMLASGESKSRFGLPVVVFGPTRSYEYLPQWVSSYRQSPFPVRYRTQTKSKVTVTLSPASTREVNARSRGSGATNKFFIRGTPSTRFSFGIGTGGRGGSEIGMLCP